MITRARVATLVVGLTCFGGIVYPEEKHQRQSIQQTSTVFPIKTYLNINNISTVFWNQGFSDIDVNDNNSGFVFPKGTGKTAVFKSGLLWGGKVNGQVRVGGSSYRTGLRSGKIISPGVAEDPNLPVNRIYRVRPDYQTADLASEILDEGKTAAEIRAQYELDWQEWPAERGAPFVDKNNNGIYEPSIDVPGVRSAGQTIWFVCNDESRSQTLSLYGSLPIGIEMQVTVWGYPASGPMSNLFFKNYLLINKDTNTVDSMYICQWSDPDIGDANDDLAGCDTALSLGYAYNGYERDATYFPLPPPAVGFRLSQGPLVPSPGSTGRSRGRTFQNFRNLPMTAFFYCLRDFFFFGDLCFGGEFGSYESSLGFYNRSKGLSRTGQPIFDPWGRQTRFMLDGDPVLETGWIDGTEFPPGDRRFGICSGPFTMAPGDTQEVIVAEVAGLGESRLSSVTKMKNNSRFAQAVYDGYFHTLPPYPLVKVQFTSPQSTRITLTADAKGTTAATMNAILRKYDGNVVASVPLFDDGMHGDGAAGDRLYGNNVTVSPLAEGLFADFDIAYSEGNTATWPHMIDDISTAGPVLVSRYTIASDNINSDGRVQPGENIRLGITINNGSQVGFSNVSVKGPNGLQLKTISLGNLLAQGSSSTAYNPNDPATYFMFDVPSDYTQREITIKLVITDSAHNRWVDSLYIPVTPLAFPVRTTPPTHVAGNADGFFGISVVDLTQVKSHRYMIEVVDLVDSTGTRGITLRDSKDGRVLLSDHPLPDTLGHLVPLTDGFKILLGSVELQSGMKDWEIPNSPPGNRRWTFADADGFRLDGFFGAIGWGSPRHFFFGGQREVGAYQVRSVLVKLATASSSTMGNPNNPNLKYGGWNENAVTDTLFSYGYRYLQNSDLPPALPEFAPYIINAGPGYMYQDYKKGIPFAAYDADSVPLRRLAVGFLENNVDMGLIDGKLWPPGNGSGVTNTSPIGPREWFFIFDRSYTGSTPEPSLQANALLDTLPIMWWGTVNRRGGANFSQPPLASGDDQFLIIARHPITSQDRYVFSLDSIVQNFVPSGFRLRQNYPNPFNPNTTIAYDLPTASRVVIKIYNVLGQEVKALLDEQQQLGFNSTVWDGTNAEGNQVSTGAYFYRIEAFALANPGQSFTQVKKMMIIR